MAVDISVIIPVFKVEKYIAKCVVSLFEQTKKDSIEFIFINDCSPDKSIEIVKQLIEKYPHRKSQVKIINNSKNLGVGDSRIKGIKVAQGTYIIHCDPDDIVQPDCYEKMLAYATKFNKEIVISDYITNKGEKLINIKVPEFSNSSELFNLVVTGHFHLGLWNKLILKKLYEDISIPNNLSLWEDVCFLLQILLKNNNIGFLHEPLYTYYRNNSSITKSTDPKHVKSQLKVAHHLLYLFNNNLLSDLNCKDIIRFKWNSKYKLIFPPNENHFKEWYKYFPEIKFAFLTGNLTLFSRFISFLMIFKSYTLIKFFSKLTGKI